MADNIENIIADIKDNKYARPNRWEALVIPGGGITVPIGMKNMLEQCVLPGVSIETTEIREHGPIRPVPFSVSFEDITLVYKCSEDHKEYKFWQDWTQEIVQYEGGSNHMTMGYYDTFVGTIVVSQLDLQDQETTTIEIHECYPKLVAPIQLNNNERNSYETVTITIGNRGWTRIQ
jgi:hypothetical protein